MQSFFLHSGLTGLYKLLQNKKIGTSSILYLFICSLLLYKYGVNTNGEATKYIEDAHRILNGENLRRDFFSNFYLVYSLLVSFFIHFSLSFEGLACFQILVSFVAACCIYKIILNITGDNKTSLIFFIAYLICFPIQKWNFFIYTESLHTSLTVIGFYFIYCIFQKNQIERWWMLVILLLLIIFSRPVGIIFLGATILAWLFWLIKKKRKIIYFPVIIILIASCFIFLQSKYMFFLNPDSLRRMEIICQVPQNYTGLDYKEYNNAGPGSFFHVLYSQVGLKMFIKIGFEKLVSFFGMIRSFYSPVHNIILLITIIILYSLAISGMFFLKNDKSFYIKLFSTLYILITAAGIFFTCDEWSNRFIAPVLPHIIFLAGLGFYWIKSKWIKLNKSGNEF